MFVELYFRSVLGHYMQKLVTNFGDSNFICLGGGAPLLDALAMGERIQRFLESVGLPWPRRKRGRGRPGLDVQFREAICKHIDRTKWAFLDDDTGSRGVCHQSCCSSQDNLASEHAADDAECNDPSRAAVAIG
eukprot:6044747-Amphidinium_carterae.1